jgi:hypothetical protein
MVTKTGNFNTKLFRSLQDTGAGFDFNEGAVYGEFWHGFYVLSY